MCEALIVCVSLPCQAAKSLYSLWHSLEDGAVTVN